MRLQNAGDQSSFPRASAQEFAHSEHLTLVRGNVEHHDMGFELWQHAAAILHDDKLLVLATNLLKELEIEVKTKNQEILAAQTYFDQAKEQYRVDKERFQMRIEDADAKLTQSKQQNMALQRENVALGTNFHALQSQVDHLNEEQLNVATSRNEEFQRLDALVKELRGSGATKEAQIQRLEADLIAANARHEKLDALCQQAQETIAALTSERDDWLTSAIATKNHDMVIREQIEQQREELEQLREDAQLMSLETMSLQMANKRLADDATELKLELSAASSARRAQDEALVVFEYATLVKNTNAMIQRMQDELTDTRQSIEQERQVWADESDKQQLTIDDAHSKIVEATQLAKRWIYNGLGQADVYK
ncbi:hypothetical protein AC1031_007712 [Aphanomyces cochlioides]|nr:hypothetical protein AC1031_007712 [Aphanomyces cochlioides]